MPELIEIRNVYKLYHVGDTEVQALNGVSLGISQGEFVAIMGPSGSGKSTLMNILGCLDKPTSGHYLLGGVDVGLLDETALALIRSRCIGFVFQSFNLLARASALENVELPLFYSGWTAQARKRAHELLTQVGLQGRERSNPNQLSGGQQQRVAIARALVDQRARDRNPLLLAARKLIGVAPLTPLQSNLGQQFVRAFPRLRRPARIEKRQLNIFQGAGAGKQIETLEDETDAAASNQCERGFFQQADIHSAQQVVAAGRFVETPEDIHEGGLAGARRTHNRNELALQYSKAHAVERADFDITHMVAFVDVANLDKFRHRRLP